MVTAVNAASSNIGQQFHLIRFLNRVTLFLIFMGLASLWFRHYVARGKKARAGIEEARQAYERGGWSACLYEYVYVAHSC